MIIQESQRATIFAQLSKKRKWTGRRNGHSVRIWTSNTPMGLRICWQVTRRNVNVHAKNCLTVTAAIEAVNEVLEPRQVRVAPVEAMPLVAAAASNYRLPYADN